jgi:non-specific serine/threonine protein kinase
LKEKNWDIIILDEAQAIKNPSVGQTKAVKQLQARFKIAMTGTPIENKLGCRDAIIFENNYIKFET